MVDQLPSLSRLDPVTGLMAKQNVEHDKSEYVRLVARRDALLDRIQFGSVALNAASLVALLGALGGGGEAARWLGFDATLAVYSACAFGGGVVAGGIAILHGHDRLTVEAGDAFAKMWASQRWLALLEAPDSSDDLKRANTAREQHAALKLVGFRRSIGATLFQFCSLGAWLAGMIIPLASALSKLG